MNDIEIELNEMRELLRLQYELTGYLSPFRCSTPSCPRRGERAPFDCSCYQEKLREHNRRVREVLAK